MSNERAEDEDRRKKQFQLVLHEMITQREKIASLEAQQETTEKMNREAKAIQGEMHTRNTMPNLLSRRRLFAMTVMKAVKPSTSSANMLTCG